MHFFFLVHSSVASPIFYFFFYFPSSPWRNFIPNKCCPGSNLRFSSCLSQICQEPVPRQDQPEHTEGRGPADQPGAGRGGPPEPAGPAHMAGHQPRVLQQGRHPGEWGTLAVGSWEVFCSGGWSNLQRRAVWPLFLDSFLHSAGLWYINRTQAWMSADADTPWKCWMKLQSNVYLHLFPPPNYIYFFKPFLTLLQPVGLRTFTLRRLACICSTLHIAAWQCLSILRVTFPHLTAFLQPFTVKAGMSISLPSSSLIGLYPSLFLLTYRHTWANDASDDLLINHEHISWLECAYKCGRARKVWALFNERH